MRSIKNKEVKKMQVTVEGVITSLWEKVKDDRQVTEMLIAQKGEREQVLVRLEGHRANEYSEFELTSITGRLITWVSRNTVGKMIMA